MFIIVWIGLGIVGAMISNNKGNSGFGGFILGVLLGPIGLLIAFFSSDNDQAKREKTGHTKKCPFCAEYVKFDAIICKHCGRSFTIDSDFNFDKSKVSFGDSKDKAQNNNKTLQSDESKIFKNEDNNFKVKSSVDNLAQQNYDQKTLLIFGIGVIIIIVIILILEKVGIKISGK
jgi:hypothetical protein